MVNPIIERGLALERAAMEHLRSLGHNVVNFFHPTAQQAAQRRLNIFGTTSKIPPIATAAIIAATGAATLPAVIAAGTRVAAQMAESGTGQNTLQTFLKYATYSPLTAIAQGRLSEGAAGSVGALLGTGIFIEGSNVLQAAITGNAKALVPTTAQFGAMLGSVVSPAGAHITAIGILLGRLLSGGAQAAASAAGNAGAQGAASAANFGTDFQNYVRSTNQEIANLQQALANNHFAAELSQGYQSLASGIQNAVSNIPTQFGLSVGGSAGVDVAGITALLAAGVGGYELLHHRKKYKHKKRHRKHGRRYA